ncbi:MAG: hypothetical protein Q8S03_01300 [Brevundimonas sp.]|uniref:hypothetical protein n=1 Tax=Brevundimonas sp. TaxID=1871086 RepID=UPI00273374DE|nr:hypothetical protein [Brevundimonas sp.]MDP3403292.1 hypothetical protein [Brevundimonas sp.]
MPPKPASPAHPSPEADLAFLRSIVEGGGKPSITVAICYLAGGLLYGLQCLFHIGQGVGLIRWPAMASLAFVAGITVTVLGVIVWASIRDRREAGIGGSNRGPLATRTLNAGFSSAGMVNLAMVIIFGVGAARDNDFALWLYYPAVVFGLQAAVWSVAWALKKKVWMLATSVGGWMTTVALGLLVRQPDLYLYVCTAALFLLFALPGWIMLREAQASRAA